MRTMVTAGHSVIFSGATVAIGLAVLVFINVPFIRSMGLGGMLVPIFAVAAGLTLLPALLYLLGARVNAWRVPFIGIFHRSEGQGWSRLANWIMRHAAPVFTLTTIFMLLLAVPSLFLSVEQNQLADAPGQAQAVQAGRVLQASLGGAVNPDTYVIDTGRAGGVYQPSNFAALGVFAKRLAGQTAVVKSVTWPTDKTAAQIRAAGGAGLVDKTGQLRADERRAVRGLAVQLGPRPERPAQGGEGDAPGGRAGVGGDAHRGAGDPERLQRRRLRAVPVPRPDRAGAGVPGAAAGLPLGGPAAEGGGPQRHLHPGHLRPDGDRVPVGVRREPVGGGPRHTRHRAVDPRVPVRLPLRALHGLRGVPHHAHARAATTEASRPPRRCRRGWPRRGAS